MKSAKQVSAGSEKFSDFIDGNAYYVDKTLFLRPIFASEDNIDKIKVFTRPRRFGKTLTMNMFKEFLSINPDNPGDTGRQERLFKGLDVMKDTEFVNKYMGQYPVVSMTLKRVYGKTFDDAVRMLAAVISETAAKFEYLKQSPKLNDYEKSQLELYIKHGRLLESENRYNIQLFLNFICNALYKHFSRPVVLLIDEYDVPLAKAQSRGYHSDMVDFYSQFLDILKTSGDAVYKIVMTGCLKVAKNSIFTGANNFTANTVLTKNPVFSSLMGFTADETEKFLDEFDLSKYAKLVKENYDGYRFYDQEIFCPWDVCIFISAAINLKKRNKAEDISATNYWIGTENTGTKAIKSYVGFLSKNDNQNLQDLSDGKEITITVNDELNYDMLSNHNVSDMWSLLLHTGYLTAVEDLGDGNYKVKIPNLEIKKCFDESIKASFNDALTTDNKNLDILKALSDGDHEKAQDLISDLLLSFVSLRVYANKSAPENFYEGFITGMLASFGSKVSELKVGQEAGHGYADICFRDLINKCAFVIELKVSANSGNLISDVNKALEQIEKKEYARPFLKNGAIPKVSAVGIAFYGRDCVVVTRRLK